MRRARRIGEILLEVGGVDAAGLQNALDSDPLEGERLGERLLRLGWVTEDAVARALAHQSSLPFMPGPLSPTPEARRLLPPDVGAHAMMALECTERSVTVAVSDPFDVDALERVRFLTGRRIDAVVTTTAALLGARDEGAVRELTDWLDALPAVDDETEDLAGVARSAPVARMVDHLLREAHGAGASDIHIEPVDGRVRVRFRIDGLLRTHLELPAESHRMILSRLKVLGGMDIAVRRRPQDGGFGLGGDRPIRVRASTLPLSGGEKAVLRLLDPDGAPRTLEALGFSDRDLGVVRRLGAAGQGVVLAAGPTGSGKSSSLFAALAELNQEGRNVVTLEDPVEYRLPGVNQVHVNPKAGLTFPAALRAVLRQDPDIVMIGEIRDRETAEIAMSAAVTGHLVLSTIHTVDAPGAITRLLDMGVPPYLVAGGLTGVVAQRLVRTLCRRCRGREGTECPDCPDGYSGRTGVFQVLAINDAIRDEITRDASAAVLRRLAREQGMASLAEDGRRKIAEGRTTPHEVARVVQGDPGASVPCTRCERDVPALALACPHCGTPARHVCVCGEGLRPEWRYCPRCIRPVRSMSAVA